MHIAKKNRQPQRVSRPGGHLKLGLWNVRGCSTEWKRKEIVEQIRERRYHVVVMTETRTMSDIFEMGRGIKVYNCNPNANESRNMGVAFVINESERVEVIEVVEKSGRIGLVTIRYNDKEELTILGCYAPTEVSEDEEEKERFYKNLNELIKDYGKRELIVMGDFNCRIGTEMHEAFPGCVGRYTDKDSETSRNGVRLVDLCHQHNMRIWNTMFKKSECKRKTWKHEPTGKMAQIDMVLKRSNGKVKVQDVHTSRSADANSDHFLVTVILKLPNSLRTKRKGKKRSTHCDRKNVWSSEWGAKEVIKRQDEYERILSERINGANGYKEITQAIIDSMKQLLNGKKVPKIRGKEWKDAMDKSIWREIRLKHALRRKWLEMKSEGNYEKYKDQSKKVTKMIRLVKEKHIERLATEFQASIENNELHEAYKTMKDMIRIANGRATGTVRNSTNMISDVELVKHYQLLFSKQVGVEDEWENENEMIRDDRKEITMNDIQEALEKLKRKKAPGRNGIRPECLKYGGMALWESILKLYNECWEDPLKIPKEWADAEVISIYKNKGSKKDPENYRGIFLLDTIGKVYASIVTKKIMEDVDEQIHDGQFGFRKERSTAEAIMIVRHVIQQTIDQKAEMALAFVDLTKAFDSIPRGKLYKVMKDMKCTIKGIRSVKKMMTDNVGYIRNSKECFTMERGVRQGSKEGPSLFNIIFDKILKETFTDSEKHGIKMKGKSEVRLHHLEYADDLCIMELSVKRLEMSLVKLQETLRKYGMKMNLGKTKWMKVGGTNNEKGEGERIIIDGEEIERVKEFCYLGSVITETGDNGKVIMNALKKGRQTLARLRPVLQSGKIRMRTKERIIDCILMPVLQYGLETLVIRKTDHDKLMALLNTARRMTLGYKDRKECKVEELKKKMRIRNISACIQMRRIRLWKRVKEKNGMTRKILESKMETGKMGRKPAHTKSWLKQIERDIIELNIDSIENWKGSKPADDPDYRPRLLGERERHIKCSNDHCDRMFATVKEMNRHVRNDHTVTKEKEEKMDPVGKFRCPISDCNKKYKRKGWLNRHLRECHPSYQGMKVEVSTIKRDNSNDTSNRDKKEGLNQCPFPNCNKRLPTWKGIVNHCYKIHRWSAVTKKPVRPRTAIS